MRTFREIRPWVVGLTRCMALMVLSGALPVYAGNDDVVLEPDADGVQRATIVLDSYSFTPGSLRIQAGLPVELHLENQSFLTPHNFIIDAPSVDRPVSVNVSAGESADVQLLLSTPGTYTFYCDKQLLFFPSHREEGMEGRIEVLPERR